MSKRRQTPAAAVMFDEEPPTKPRADSTDERAVALLLAHGPMSCQQLGEWLWGRTSPGGRGRPGTAPYARAAGRVLHRLERAGRVCKTSDGHHTLWSAIFKDGRALKVTVR